MKYSFKGVDWKKIGKGALIAVIGALLTYVTDLIPTFDLPTDFQPLVVAGWSIVVNVAHKWMKES